MARAVCHVAEESVANIPARRIAHSEPKDATPFDPIGPGPPGLFTVTRFFTLTPVVVWARSRGLRAARNEG